MMKPSGLLALVEGIVMVSLFAIAIMQTVRLSAEEARHARTVADHAKQIAALHSEARLAERTARAEEQRRTAAVQEIADEALVELGQARADAAAAADAGERLRQRVATLAARCSGPAGGAAPAAGGAAAPSTGDLLADVQRRLDQAAAEIARYADGAVAAGRACERAYGALTDAGGG